MRQELLWRGGQEAPQVRKERTSDAQQRREGIKHHRRAGHLASNALNAFLTQRPDAPPEARRAPAEIPEAPPSSRAARLDLMAYSEAQEHPQGHKSAQEHISTKIVPISESRSGLVTIFCTWQNQLEVPE